MDTEIMNIYMDTKIMNIYMDTKIMNIYMDTEIMDIYKYRDHGHAEDCWTGCFCWIGENWPFPMEEVCKIQILEEHLIKWQNRGSNFTRINITTLFT